VLAHREQHIGLVCHRRKKKITKMMVSKVLRTLEEKKIITRQEHEKSTRAKTIQLTKTGIETLQKAIKSKKCR
jgi:DNA-binding MarR family transcriptional regulator